MRTRNLVWAVALVLGCYGTPPRFEAYGSLHETMMGGGKPSVSLRSVSVRDAIAVGALSDLRGEVTIVDGRFWLAYPEGDGTRVLDVEASDEEAALLVVGRPSEWKETRVETDVPP